MSLISLKFFICFGTLLLVYYLVPQTLKKPVLIVFSSFFIYAAGGIFSLLFILFTSLTVYFGAAAIHKAEEEGKKKGILALVLIVNFVILFLTKYLGFFDPLLATLGMSRPAVISLIVPLGVSFYTLQITSYILDVFFQVEEPEKDIINFLSFALFFPQIASGPISRYGSLGKEMAKEKKFDYEEVTFGLQRILWGLFKKLVIAERIGIIVGTVYSDYHSYSGFYIVFAVLLFTLQLYSDFSGYMDIAVGISQCLGIKLVENFKTPFFSTSESEFWRRWHITLGAWFRDYVFYPLLKSKPFISLAKKAKGSMTKRTAKLVPTTIALFFVWFFIGFWHGGSWNYIVGSGLLHWFYIVSGEWLQPLFDIIKNALHIGKDNVLYTWFSRLRTYILFSSGLLFFRSTSLRSALSMIGCIFTGNNEIFSKTGLLRLGLDGLDYMVLVIALVVLGLVEIVNEKDKSLREIVSKRNIVIRWALYFALLFAVIIFGMYGPDFIPGQFIYEKF